MDNNQTGINFNNQTSERNTKMGSQVENRITDEILKVYKSELLSAASIGSISYKDAKNLAFDYVKKQFGISGDFTTKEYAYFGNPSKQIARLFFQKKIRKHRKVSPPVPPVITDTQLDLMNGSKKCAHCGEILSLENFHNHKGSKDGKQSWCKHCVHEYSKLHRRHVKQETQEESVFVATSNNFEEFDSYTFTVKLNRVQVYYSDGILEFSTVDGINLLKKEDVQDLQKLLSRAEDKVTSRQGSN